MVCVYLPVSVSFVNAAATHRGLAREVAFVVSFSTFFHRSAFGDHPVLPPFDRHTPQVLLELSPQGLHAVFERFRGILHEGQIDKRVQYTIETLFAVRKSNFSDHPAVPLELDLVERDDQITFEIGLEDKLEEEEMLDIFKVDDK